MAPNNPSPTKPGNPNMKLLIPAWINEDYFQPILEKDYPDLQRIVRFTTIAATGPGENYSSIMVRVYIDIELKNSTIVPTSYILKTMIEGSETGDLLSSMNMFPKEREVYDRILPQFEKLYAEAGKTVSFGPKCKFVEETPERITIVMEDLKPRKFENIERRFGFDLMHIENVLKKLAEFHAVSAVQHERFGPFPEIFSHSFINEKSREYFTKIAERKRALFLHLLTKWGDCDKYVDLWPAHDEYIEWFIKNQDGSPDEFLVLNHGDCWSNNIMFNYTEDGDIDETLFVDFQLCKWGSPAQDLYYMITASAGYDIRVKEFDRFLRIYQEHLAVNLKLLGFSKPIPSLKDIHGLMIKYSLWSFFTATSVMAAILLDPVDNATMDNLLTDPEFMKLSLMSPRYVKTMKQLLPWWENRGVFQIDI